MLCRADALRNWVEHVYWKQFLPILQTMYYSFIILSLCNTVAELSYNLGQSLQFYSHPGIFPPFVCIFCYITSILVLNFLRLFSHPFTLTLRNKVDACGERKNESCLCMNRDVEAIYTGINTRLVRFKMLLLCRF